MSLQFRYNYLIEAAMEIVLKDVRVNYRKSGEQGAPVVLLHGWGQNIEMMEPIEMHLMDAFQVYNIDLPGFGESEEPKTAWSVYDYEEWLEAFCEALEIENPILICHSFGARLGIIYASKNPVKKMVITGGAGIKDKHGLDYYTRVYSYKAAKKVLTVLHMDRTKEQLMRNAGSSDYKNTSGVKRETFVKVVNEDLSYLLSKVSCETLLVWGDKDEMTPLWMGQKMEKEMPNAGLAIFEGDDHFAYYHQMARFLKVIDIFLR